jgi:MFS family permease
VTEARRTYPAVWVGQFAATAGLTVVVPLMPFFLADLGVPGDEVAWWTALALAAPAAAQAFTAPLWGAVGDRVGPKAMVVRAYAGLALALALMALVDTPAAFLVCRVVQGACGGVVSATAAYLTALAPQQRRGRALGGIFGATAAGSLLGPLAGGVLAGQAGFPVLFAAVAGLLAGTAVLAAMVLPSVVPEHTTVRRPRLADAAAGLARHPVARNLLLAGLLGQSATFALVVVFAPQVERITATAAAATVWVGVLQATTWAGSLAGAPWWGRRNDRRPAQAGFAVAACCCGLAVLLQALPSTPEWLLLLRAAQGFCFAALGQSVLHVACSVVHDQVRGTAIGLSNGVLDVGQVVGPFLAATVATALSPAAAFPVIALLFLLAAALALRGGARPSALSVDRPLLIEVTR